MIAHFSKPLLNTLLVASVVISSNVALAVTPASVDELQLDQLTVLVAQAMPISDVFAQLKEQMPTWPFQDNSGAVTSAQLKCVRQELNYDNYLAQTKTEVKNYIKTHPTKVASDIQLLTNSSKLWTTALRAGIANPAYNADEGKKVLGESKPEELLAVLTLIQSSSNEDLRQLIGIGGLKLDEKQSNSKQIGKDAAMAKMFPLLLNSMTTCNVPLKSLF